MITAGDWPVVSVWTNLVAGEEAETEAGEEHRWRLEMSEICGEERSRRCRPVRLGQTTDHSPPPGWLLTG